MQVKIESDPPERIPAQGQNESHLLRWLADPRTAEFFGAAFELKAAVLACRLRGGNLSAVARQHGVSRAATSKIACRAKTIFGDLSTAS